MFFFSIIVIIIKFWQELLVKIVEWKFQVT